MGNWGYNPTYTGYNLIYNWYGPHLVRLVRPMLPSHERHDNLDMRMVSDGKPRNKCWLEIRKLLPTQDGSRLNNMVQEAVLPEIYCVELEQFTNRAIVYKPKHSHVNGKSHFGTSIFLVAMSLRSWKAAPAPVTWSSRWNASNILHTWKVPSPPQLAKGKIMCHIIFPSKIHLISYHILSIWFILILSPIAFLPYFAHKSQRKPLASSPSTPRFLCKVCKRAVLDRGLCQPSEPSNRGPSRFTEWRCDQSVLRYNQATRKSRWFIATL